ncbi:hypothetical protein ACFL1H_08145, partial [Nanoarchaeota archaeon]
KFCDGLIEGSIENQILYNNADNDIIDKDNCIKNVFKNKEGESKYNQLMKQYKVNQFITLTKLLETQKPEQMFKTLNKLDTLYDSIKDNF